MYESAPVSPLSVIGCMPFAIEKADNGYQYRKRQSIFQTISVYLPTGVINKPNESATANVATTLNSVPMI